MQYDPASRQYRAPLQLKANGGIFILDDLGRQRVAPATVLNRWIVPMEEGVGLSDAQHRASTSRTPFDVILVFSTNLNPDDLVDDAFLRRIGYKIRFDALTAEQYHSIWRGVCEENDVALRPERVPVHDRCAACASRHAHVAVSSQRDLIGMALDRMEYLKGDGGAAHAICCSGPGTTIS